MERIILDSLLNSQQSTVNGQQSTVNGQHFQFQILNFLGELNHD
ncbi:hypothetical protein [Nostoc linckia]|nr:hypothetical protein [Nostoc linckia]